MPDAATAVAGSGSPAVPPRPAASQRPSRPRASPEAGGAAAPAAAAAGFPVHLPGISGHVLRLICGGRDLAAAACACTSWWAAAREAAGYRLRTLRLPAPVDCGGRPLAAGLRSGPTALAVLADGRLAVGTAGRTVFILRFGRGVLTHSRFEHGFVPMPVMSSPSA